MSVCEFQHKRRLPEPDEPIEGELTYGIVYRKKKKGDDEVAPVESPLNLPYKICLADQTLKRKQWKKQQEKLKQSKKTIPAPKKYNLLQLSSFSQKQYMKYLAQPNKKVDKPRFKPPPPLSPKKYCKALNFFSPRLEQMAVPKKRHVFSTWQSFQSILPIEAQIRFQKILHYNQNVDPKIAREYFKRIDREKQKKKREKLRLKRKKELEKKRGDKKWIKQQIDKVANKIVEFFKNEPLFTLNYKQLLLSDGILSTLEKRQVQKKPNRQTKNHYKKSIVDIADKCAIWIDMLTQFVDVQVVDSEQDIPSTIGPSITEEEEEEESEESEYSSEEEESEGEEGPLIIWGEQEEGEEFEYPEYFLEKPEEGAAEELGEEEQEAELEEVIEEQEEDNNEEPQEVQEELETIKETEEETEKQEDNNEEQKEDEVVEDKIEEEAPPPASEETAEVVEEVKSEEKTDEDPKVDEQQAEVEEGGEGKEIEIPVITVEEPTVLEEAVEEAMEQAEEQAGEEAVEEGEEAVEETEEAEVEGMEEEEGEGEGEGEEQAIEEELGEPEMEEETEEVREEPVSQVPVVEEPKPIVVEHYPDLVCCTSLRTSTLWLLYIAQNAYDWTLEIENTIRQVRHYANVLRGKHRTPNGDIEVLNPRDWLAFVKETESKQKNWQNYSGEVKNLTDEIVKKYKNKKMKCCPKCVQGNLIQNVRTAYDTVQSLTEAMNNACNWQMFLDRTIRKAYNVASSSFYKPQTRRDGNSKTYEIEEVDPALYGKFQKRKK